MVGGVIQGGRNVTKIAHKRISCQIIFGALIDCYRVKLLKTYGVQCFRALEPIMWVLNEDNVHFVSFWHCKHEQVVSPDKNCTFAMYFTHQISFLRFLNVTDSVCCIC